MPIDRTLGPKKRKRMRHAERKLKEAKRQFARTERSILYWPRIVADLKHERMRAIQPPLWPEEEDKLQNLGIDCTAVFSIRCSAIAIFTRRIDLSRRILNEHETITC
jgi:hypothetical protein